MSRTISFPRQKLSDSKKTDKWHKECVDFGESLLHDTKLRASHKNKQINLDLAINKIDRADFERIINPDNLPPDTIPAEFKHIGIENNKDLKHELDLIISKELKLSRPKKQVVDLSFLKKEEITKTKI
mgnify:CR=1 FL=1